MAPPAYQKRYGRLSANLRAKVLAVSAAQIDRLLAPAKARVKTRGRCGTKPGARKRLLNSYLNMRALEAKARKDGLAAQPSAPSAHMRVGQESHTGLSWCMRNGDIQSHILNHESSTFSFHV